MIIHVTPSYPPRLGGLEKVAQLLAQMQHKMGTRVIVITTKQKLPQPVAAEEFPVMRLNNFMIASTRIMPSLPFKLLRFNRQDTVRVHFASAYIPEIVWLIAEIKKYSYIMHLHIELGPTTRAGFLLRIYKPLVFKYVLRAANFVVVFTQEQRQAVHEQYGVDLKKIKVVPNGVEDKFYNTKPRTLHPKPHLLFVGRLEFQKNLTQLLNVLNGVSDKFVTTIVGSGDLENNLKNQAIDLRLQNITFTGRADGEQLLRYYRESDIFVLTSEREGMPLVLLEAMAMGLPIVATNVSGTRDVVRDSVNGFLVPYGDIEKFRSVLLKIKSNDKLYAKLSDNSCKLAKQYSWDKVSAQFEKLYEEAHE